jgi:TPR repeat protein
MKVATPFLSDESRHQWWQSYRERARDDPAIAWALARWFLPNSQHYRDGSANESQPRRDDVVHWLIEAANGGIWQAAATCARRYAYGTYPFDQNGRNPIASVEYWHKAVATNDPFALCRFGESLIRGDGIPKNVAHGAIYLFNAAVMGHVDAMMILYQLHYDVQVKLPLADELAHGIKPIPHDTPSSSSATDSTGHATNNDSGGPFDSLSVSRRAIGWARAAALAGDAEGSYQYGRANMEGRILPRDLSLAKTLFEYAHQQKHIHADWSLNVLLPLHQLDDNQFQGLFSAALLHSTT